MSEESAPKLRLKPKLAADLSTVQQPAISGTPEAEMPPAVAPETPPPAPVTPAAEEAKSFRLKPRLPTAPAQEAAPAAAAEAEAAPVSPPAAEAPAAFPVEEAPAAEKPVAKFSLKPRTGAAPTDAPAPATEAAGTEALPAILDAPPPPSAPEAGAGAELADVKLKRKPSMAPFPPPPKAPFPPPPGAKPPAAKKTAVAGGSVKKLMLIGGIAVVVLAGGFFAYRKLTAEPPPPRPKPAAKPAPLPVETVAANQTAVDPTKEAATAPANQVVQSTPAPSTTENKPAETPAATTLAPVVVAPPPPPLPSMPFKAWVENLKIGGLSVRAGKPIRMTIGKTTYDIGDQVNPQLGISFEAYNVENHTLTFKDKSGAKVDKRP